PCDGRRAARYGIYIPTSVPTIAATESTTAVTATTRPADGPSVTGTSGPGAGARCMPLCGRSEEHTFELQSPYDLVCRLPPEKKNPPPPAHTPPLADAALECRRPLPRQRPLPRLPRPPPPPTPLAPAPHPPPRPSIRQTTPHS